jgi:phage terminase small subunit
VAITRTHPRRLAPELRRTNRLSQADEFTFMQFCIYAQEWTAQTDDLHEKGFTQKIATVAGGKMERRRPSVFDRQQAFSNGMHLSAKFGLTPVDMYDLFKGQRAVVESNPTLFGKSEPGSPATPDPEAPPVASRVGSFGLHRSTPPGERPN